MVFSTFCGQKEKFKKKFKIFSNHIEKLHKMAFIIFFSIFWKSLKKLKQLFFLGLILRFSNLNVLHKGLLMQEWVFGLGFFLKLCITFKYLRIITKANKKRGWAQILGSNKEGGANNINCILIFWLLLLITIISS